MFKIGFIFSFLLLMQSISAQQCFTIETILADACGDPEGENEMVTLRVNENLDINNLSFVWPNNNFLGWCTAPGKIIQLNQTIISSCGLLLEPPNGIVPAGKKLIVVSSTNMLVNANSFEGLTDTIYIIFQCIGNTAGHFSNSANSPRSLQVNYNGTCVSAQTVSYTPTSLIGGDGGAIFYDTLGVGTYYNTGCNAPVPGLNPFWNFPLFICNDYGLVDLNTLLSGNASTGGTWSGDIENQNFFNPSGKLGAYTITYTLIDTSSCLGAADSSLNFIVEDLKVGGDTVIVCDSIRQFGFWIFADTLIEINVANPNPFRCDSIVQRFYKINQANYRISPEAVLINSGEEIPFSIIGNNPSYEFWNEQEDTCFMPCLVNTIRPSQEGVYTFRVVDNDNLCEKFLTLDIQLIFFSELNIPTAFTPNGDGFNDRYKIYGKDLQTLEFNIFSEWGERVFVGRSINDSWDGTLKGKPLSSGIYLLQINAAGKDGERYEELKKIKLIR